MSLTRPSFLVGEEHQPEARDFVQSIEKENGSPGRGTHIYELG
jgi:hypothetical protein